MNTKDYLQLKAGTIEHSMMLTGVNITEDGAANRWKLEKSNEIDGPNGGYYTCSGTWFDKYMFSAVINKKYLEEYLKEYEGTPFGFDLWEII
jgi:bleomycin hydrolase